MTVFVRTFLCCSGLLLTGAAARDLQPKPADGFFQKYEGWLAPKPAGLILQQGDRLAICGDSITEQRMYSRIMEAYLTACVPDLGVTCRQYGWSGEQASGFFGRMKNDVLRFAPSVATTCYGMNDHRYVPYTEEIGGGYRKHQSAIVRAFKEAGCRVVLGSPGCIHTVPGWVKSAAGSWEDLNLSLLRLRNIDVEIAEAEGIGFADVFWPMLTAGHAARQKFGESFRIEGGDGVHPGWAGQTVMAFAFLTALGLDGNLGSVTVNLATGKAAAEGGHAVTAVLDGSVHLKSRRMVFCAAGGDPGKDDNIRAGMALCGFNAGLNRFTLKVTDTAAPVIAVTWGPETHEFSREQLAAGVNLADTFQRNGMSAAFDRVWVAAGTKQDYETKQIKQFFHGPEGKADMEATVRTTEAERAQLAGALHAAFAPVDHVIKIEPRAAE